MASHANLVNQIVLQGEANLCSVAPGYTVVKYESIKIKCCILDSRILVS